MRENKFSGYDISGTNRHTGIMITILIISSIYSEEQKKVISEPVKLEQNYRNFDYESPWEGTKYIKELKGMNDKEN